MSNPSVKGRVYKANDNAMVVAATHGIIYILSCTTTLISVVCVLAYTHVHTVVWHIAHTHIHTVVVFV